MAERGEIKLNIERGATVAEFTRFLTDLENAYMALLHLPNERSFRGVLRGRRLPIDFMDIDPRAVDPRDAGSYGTYPKDLLELSRISIRSPGWIELIGSLNPLHQIREYLKDRHERAKDRAWRSDAEKERALLENAVLRDQAERGQISTIGAF